MERMIRTMVKSKPKIFVVAGMPRAGTTYLYHNFQLHPNVCAPLRKETNYFSVSFGQGEQSFSDLFREMKPDQIGIDASPPYFVDENAVERIKAYDPDIKVILGVRKPSNWIISMYNQINTYKFNMEPFEEFIQGFDYKIADPPMKVTFEDTWVTRRIEAFQAVFGKNLLIYDFDFFSKNPLLVLQTIEKFVGIESFFDDATFERQVINAGGRKNLKVLTYLAVNERLLRLVRLIFSERRLRIVRNAVTRYTSNKPQEKSAIQIENARKISETFFEKDDEFVVKLFADSQMLTGDGSPVIQHLGDQHNS